MTSSKPQSAGGIAWGKIQRESAIKNYLNDPNYCKCCNSIIPVSEEQMVCHVRKKVFCNASCAATYNNARKPKKEKVLIPKKVKIRLKTFENSSKGALFQRAKNWQSARSCIRQHAYDIFNSLGEKSCKRCKYDKHIEVCHIKSVSSFSEETTILEINDPSNLIGLCPNCHWEFDNDLLTLEEIGCAGWDQTSDL